MYTCGLSAAVLALLHAPLYTQLIVLVTALWLVVPLVLSLKRPESPVDEPPCLQQSSVLNIWPFYRKRFNFLNWGFHAVGDQLYQFYVLKHKVIVVSGERGRNIFFSSKGLDLHEGFKTLLGAIPIVPGVTSDLHHRQISLVHKRLAALQRNESLVNLIPAILEDSRRKMDGWGVSGTCDPFEALYDLVFQTSVRCLTSVDIADNEALVDRLRVLYRRLDDGTTPASVLLPWFPSPAMLKKLWATNEVYQIVSRAIRAREQSGVARNDTLQMLMDEGDDKMAIVGFIMGLLIAGARSTGTTFTWLTIFLAGHPDWAAKAAAEVSNLLSTHSPPASDVPALSARLARIPLEAWEAETPTLDALIHETLRVAQPHTAMRRNVGPPLAFGERVVPTGAFVIYPFSDVHLNAQLYPEPRTFNPARPRHPEGKSAFAYLGWGGGKTMCQGQRLARLKLKLLASMLLLGFDMRLVDRAGKPAARIPQPDWNDILTCRPSTGACFLKYDKSDVML